MLDEFITHTLGEAARRHYRIIIDDAAEVARLMKKAMPQVKENRRDTGDAYSFNWSMRIAPDLQVPFEPSHENMANLKLYPDQPVEILAADLRRAFSGIVAGNVKEVGIRAIEANGPYKIHGDREMMRRMDDLLQGFVAQHRMKLPVPPTSPVTRSALSAYARLPPAAGRFSIPFIAVRQLTHAFIFMMIIRGIARIVL